MLALSFLFGIWLAFYRAKKAGLNTGNISDFSFYVIISSIIGARLYFVILHWEEFALKPVFHQKGRCPDVESGRRGKLRN
jgi:phosphatidylglycerol:prolipoprotein diacylglycerol transferase